jgi:hypothetical protein
MPDGKPENTFAFDGEFQGPEFAKRVKSHKISRIFIWYNLVERRREFFVHFQYETGCILSLK